ncbi:MFS transporter [Candidatus Deianiraea vastatrix]|uniref:MFS transporter n=1 Tax=Candidatus Deianiraea vastatrix TaxID=2163644 RepID=A0A5B8XGA9_9RICK|nr:MFS transporter [Candidatus Deianiraea vastatrix]QED23261.1 Putative MFS transporter [Candidatus Deianiraea vastatrix]
MKLLIYLVLLFIAEAEIEICVPAFPIIKSYFNLSEFEVEWLFGANVLAHCIGAIFAGIIGDKYGKKKTMLYGFIILSIGSLVTVIANSYPILILGRIIQGLGMSGPVVVCYPMFIESVKDGAQRLKIIGYFNAAFAFAVGFAPSIGSFATILFGANGSFKLMLFLSVIAVFITHFILKYDDIKSENTDNIGGYLPILKSKDAMLPTIFNNCTIYLPYITMIPLVFVNEMGVSQEKLGFYAGFGAMTWGLGNIFLGHLTKFIKIQNIIKISLSILCFGGLMLLFLALFPHFASPVIITAVFCFTISGFIIPANEFYLHSLDKMPDAKAKIGTIGIVVRFVTGSIATQIASYFYTSNFTSTAFVMCFMLLIIIPSGILMYRRKFLHLKNV